MEGRALLTPVFLVTCTAKVCSVLSNGVCTLVLVSAHYIHLIIPGKAGVVQFLFLSVFQFLLAWLMRAVLSNFCP